MDRGMAQHVLALDGCKQLVKLLASPESSCQIAVSRATEVIYSEVCYEERDQATRLAELAMRQLVGLLAASSIDSQFAAAEVIGHMQ